MRVFGTPIRYEVTLEPHNRPWLMVMDVAPDRPELSGMNIVRTTDLQWLTTRPVTDLLRYRAQSYPDFRYGPTTRTGALEADLRLPPGFNPRTLALAAQMRRDPRYAQAGADVLVPAVLDRLRTGGYIYTLEPGVYGQHTADEFWFDRQQGFCEHIASAFVILMRALDIPARVIAGYQGGDMNAVDGYWTVRQSDAHAWAEVWHAGRGWVRVDPTGAVAPGRIGSLQRLQAPAGLLVSAIGNVSPDIAARMRAGWEAINNRWNQWVLNYSQSRQLDLLRQLGFSAPDWQDLSTVLLGLLVAASVGGVGWAMWDRRQHDPWLRLVDQARGRLRAAGFALPAHAAPRHMAQLVASGNADNARSLALRDWLLQMEALRYARAPSAKLPALRRAFRRLPWPPATPSSDRPSR